jgi:hypothetical protein
VIATTNRYYDQNNNSESQPTYKCDFKFSQLAPFEANKYLEDVKNGIYPLTSYGLNYPSTLNKNLPTTINTNLNSTVLNSKSSSTLVSSAEDLENNKNTSEPNNNNNNNNQQDQSQGQPMTINQNSTDDSTENDIEMLLTETTPTSNQQHISNNNYHSKANTITLPTTPLMSKSSENLINSNSLNSLLPSDTETSTTMTNYITQQLNSNSDNNNNNNNSDILSIPSSLTNSTTNIVLPTSNGSGSGVGGGGGGGGNGSGSFASTSVSMTASSRSSSSSSSSPPPTLMTQFSDQPLASSSFLLNNNQSIIENGGQLHNPSRSSNHSSVSPPPSNNRARLSRQQSEIGTFDQTDNNYSSNGQNENYYQSPLSSSPTATLIDPINNRKNTSPSNNMDNNNIHFQEKRHAPKMEYSLTPLNENDQFKVKFTVLIMNDLLKHETTE